MASQYLAEIIKANYPTADLDSLNPNVALTDDGSGVVISLWTIVDPQPTIAALDALEAAYLASVTAETAARGGRKTAVLAKLGLISGDIQAFNELVEDGTISYGGQNQYDEGRTVR